MVVVHIQIYLPHVYVAGSPHASRKYTFSMFETNSVGEPSEECGSGRVSPVIMSPSWNSRDAPTFSPSQLKIVPGNEVEAQLVITEDDGVCVCACLCDCVCVYIYVCV